MWKIALLKSSFSMSMGVKWCQFKNKDLLISISNGGLKGVNCKTTFQEGGENMI